jgi:streptogramin lyase
MTTSGAATDYSLGATGLGLTGIAVRSNGVVWFCARNTNQIGRLII